MGRAIWVSVLTVAVVAGSAAAETLHAEHRFDATPGASLLVDVSFHDVEVQAVAGASSVEVAVDLEVTGAGAEGRLEKLRPEFLVEGDRLVVRSLEGDRGFSFGWGRTQGRVAVSLPPGLDLVVDGSSGQVRIGGDLGDAAVTVDTSSGGVEVDGAMGELAADTSSGSVKVRVSRPLARFRADTSSGDVLLVGGAHDAAADASSGSLDLANLTGELVADTSSGSVTASWRSVAPGARVHVDTSSGGVELTFPKGTTVGGLVSTSSGSLRADFPGTLGERGRELELAGGAGAIDLRVDTSSGPVDLRAR